jgi:hypothetical protein
MNGTSKNEREDNHEESTRLLNLSPIDSAVRKAQRHSH